MTLLDILKTLLGTKAEEEIDLNLGKEEDKNELPTKEDNVDNEEVNVDNTEESKEALEENKDTEDTLDNTNVDSAEDTDSAINNKGGADMVLFEDGWLNTDTGEVDITKIKNQEVLEAIQTLQGRYNAEKEERLIAESLSTELKNYALAVSEDTIKKVLDMSDVNINKQGKVMGVKEAIEALKEAEPGFFKDKTKESNPLNEGFNPVEKLNTTNINSFSQAFRIMDEVN